MPCAGHAARCSAPGLTLKPHKLHLQTISAGNETLHSDINTEDLFTDNAFTGNTSLINLPLIGRAETVGVMSIYYLDNRHPTNEHLKAVRLLSFQAATSIENAQIYNILEEYVAEISKLSHATSSLFTSLSSSAHPHKVYENIIDCVLNAFGQVDCGLIGVEGDTVQRLARKGEYDVKANQQFDLNGPGLVPAAIRTGETVYVPDVSKDPRYLANEPRTRSELVVPLKKDDTVIGVLDLQSTQLDAFSDADQRLLAGFATRAATTLENVQLMKHLKDSEERFRQLAENITDVFFLCSLDFESLLYVSPAYSSVWGHPVAALYNDFLTALLRTVHDEDRQQVSEEIRDEGNRLLQNPGPAQLLEFRIVTDEHETRWIRMQIFPVHDETGAVYRVAILAHDSTHERRAASLSAAGEVATGIAHQISNPLTAIIAQSYLMRNRMPEDSPFRNSLDIIMSSAHRAGEVARRLLDFSHVPSYEFEMLDINDTIHYALDLLRAQLPPDKIQFNVSLEEELPPLYGSRRHLEELWLNLLFNARDAVKDSQPATITITCKQRESDDTIEVTVRDNGYGISSDNIELIFDPFFTTKSSGNGLGLTMCRDVAIRHGGEIEVESESGKGTSFVVTFPATNPEADDDPDFTLAGQISSSES